MFKNRLTVVKQSLVAMAGIYLRPVIFGFAIYSYLLVITNTLQRYWHSTIFTFIILFLPLAVIELLVSFISNKAAKKDNVSWRTGVKSRIIILYIIYCVWLFSLYAEPEFTLFNSTGINSVFLEGVFVLISHPLWFLIAVLLILTFAAVLFRKRSKGSFVYSLLIFPVLIILVHANFNFDIMGGLEKPLLINELKMKGVEIFEYPNNKCITSFSDRLRSPFKYPGVPAIDSKEGKVYLPIGTNNDYTGCPNIIRFNLDGSGTLTKMVQKENYPHKKLVKSIVVDNTANRIMLIFYSDWRGLLIFDKKVFALTREISLRLFSEGKLNEDTVFDSIIFDAERRKAFISTGFPPALISLNLNAKDEKGSNSDFAINSLSAGDVNSYDSLNNLIYDKENNLIYAFLVERGYRSKIFEFNAETLELKRELIINNEISSMELDGQRDVIYAAIKWSRDILVINRMKMEVIHRRSSPALYVSMIRVDPIRNMAYVVDYLQGRLIIMDRDLSNVRRIWDVGNKPRGIDVDNKGIYIASTLGVIRIKNKSTKAN